MAVVVADDARTCADHTIVPNAQAAVAGIDLATGGNLNVASNEQVTVVGPDLGKTPNGGAGADPETVGKFHFGSRAYHTPIFKVIVNRNQVAWNEEPPNELIRFHGSFSKC